MVLLTSEDFIKEISNISDNISGKFLRPAMRETQDIDLQGVLGSRLYTVLKGMVDDDTIMNEENTYFKQLLDESQYFLAYGAIARLCLLTSYKLSNYGVSITNDEHINAPSFKEIIDMQDTYINKADFYKKRLQEWILNNRENFTDYLSDCDCKKIESNLYSAATCGLFLGGARGK